MTFPARGGVQLAIVPPPRGFSAAAFGTVTLTLGLVMGAATPFNAETLLFRRKSGSYLNVLNIR